MRCIKFPLIREAFSALCPQREFSYEAKIKYSGKFKGYNANVRLFRNTLTFSLSKKWKTISKEIRIGLLQSLMVKLFKIKKTTDNIEMYNSFLKYVHIAIPKTKSHPILEESFDRVNGKYFFGLIEKPNLRFGKDSSYQLGSYDYGTDTITISNLLSTASIQMLDYVMYHELLHKKHKFIDINGKSYHHTSEFRRKEREFENSELIEKELKRLGRKKEIRRLFNLF